MSRTCETPYFTAESTKSDKTDRTDKTDKTDKNMPIEIK